MSPISCRSGRPSGQPIYCEGLPQCEGGPALSDLSARRSVMGHFEHNHTMCSKVPSWSHQMQSLSPPVATPNHVQETKAPVAHDQQAASLHNLRTAFQSLWKNWTGVIASNPSWATSWRGGGDFLQFHQRHPSHNTCSAGPRSSPMHRSGRPSKDQHQGLTSHHPLDLSHLRSVATQDPYGARQSQNFFLHRTVTTR